LTYDIPPPRPLPDADKKRDLIRLITWGKSLLDPPPALGRTKALARKPARGWIGLHLKEHGSCSSWKWFLRPMAQGVVAAREAEGALRFGRMYSYWSDSRLPNSRGPMFRDAKAAKPLPGSHRKMTTPWEDLVAKAKRALLRPQDERQLWACFRDTATRTSGNA